MFVATSADRNNFGKSCDGIKSFAISQNFSLKHNFTTAATSTDNFTASAVFNFAQNHAQVIVQSLIRRSFQLGFQSVFNVKRNLRGTDSSSAQ